MDDRGHRSISRRLPSPPAWLTDGPGRTRLLPEPLTRFERLTGPVETPRADGMGQRATA